MHHIKKLTPVLVILAAMGVLLLGVGFLSPVQRVARCQAVIRMPVEEVWATIADLPGWPAWQEEFDWMRPQPDRNGHTSYLARGSWGNVPIEVERMSPPYELVTLMNTDEVKGSWTFELEICPAGTQLTITEYGEVENPLLRGAMLLTDEHGSMKDFLNDLQAKLDVMVVTTEKDLTLDQFQLEKSNKAKR